MARAKSSGKSPYTSLPSPILRWIGGKRQLVSHLISFLPGDISNRRYREPFLGAGWLFFALRPKRAVLSDANEHLIKCYEFVRDSWEQISKLLRQHGSRDSEAYYYRVRAKYNSSRYSAGQAARFIYLNKSCFNGIFRVNEGGHFNVPYGWKDRPALPDAEQLQSVAELLRLSSLSAQPFEEALRKVSEEDFVYLDPPYPPLNGETAYFTHYTKDRFNGDDQQRLAEVTRELNSRGCKFMMSNSDSALIRRLYKGFHIHSLPVIRYVTCKSIKHKASEVVITNYRPEIGHGIPEQFRGIR
jgi:DNA adenine methylase